ncbi:phosphotransferase [Pseudooceanicola sp. CBS1P-1]|uniref:Phosphotransferase n=1 Tax=Pseudooceanicola albus TaxID=2692189 RepID=A0A6L7G1N2_9RHOB|nr:MULTISPECIES: phosphotransferase [Pseudooceanicola]MBT9383510.1 phosphotransferase [Pseudooceanicola endophyticus]MXN17366.1 phosphotransferase [Pseudooceanicola albus]
MPPQTTLPDSTGPDLGSLATPFTPLTREAAAELALRYYGLEGSFKRLATEKDDTFAVRRADGSRVILKIANPGESAGELDLQLQALLHLEARAPEMPVPRVLRSADGQILPALPTPEGPRRARVMTFLEGEVLDRLPPLPEEQIQIGTRLAELRLAMAGFEHPHATRALAWDVRHLPSLAGLLEDVADPAQKRALSRAFDQIRALAPRIDALPRQVVHNDFSRSNLLVDRSRAQSVTGIIDFGDVVHTAVAIDLSTAMLNQLPRDAEELGQGDMFDGPRRVLQGYLSRAPLSTEELALLPHLVFARVVTRTLLTLWRAREFPENRSYILRNTTQGWAQLDWYLSRDPAALSTLLT